MISFIIIGRNIENTIRLCLESVVKFIQTNRIPSWEILYVDSDSTDRSVELAMEYPVSIYKITGEVNAAVGRNTGARYASGDILFFIDGDMELLSDCYPILFDIDNHTLKYPYSTGHLRQKVYSNDFKFLYDDDEPIKTKTYLKHATGGFSIISRSLREEVGEMDERLVRNQDLDFSLRASKMGFPVKKYNIYSGIHHTISYFDSNRIKSFLLNKNLLFPGVLLRKHITYPIFLKRNYKTLLYSLLLILSLSSIIVYYPLGISLIAAYLIIHIIRSLTDRKAHRFLWVLLYHNISSIFLILGFIGFYPKVPKYKIERLAKK